MGKIYIIGEDSYSSLIKENNNIHFIYPSFDEDINDFVINNLRDLCVSDIIVFDLDNGNWEKECEVALHIRLTPEVPDGRLVPFVFTSTHSLNEFLNGIHSQIFLTKGCHFISPEDLECELQHQQSFTLEEYTKGFLKRISIRPEGEGDGHSIANEWGAKALAKMLPSYKKIPVSKILKNKEGKLYFKYRMALSNSSIFTDNYKYKPLEEPIDVGDKKILLIDDEADEGWKVVLDAMIISASGISVFNQKAKNYNQLSPNVRHSIENNYFDLVFLDLRMNGIDEEKVYNPSQFSGMKILKEIKSKNRGIQVIIFTASNKAWNLKALIDAGADGYYIKESPEYGFSDKFSEANSGALCDSIKRCIARSYLKNIYSSIQELEKGFDKNQRGKTEKDYKDFLKEILNQIKLAFELENHTDPTDTSDEGKRKFANAYVILYQVIEQINKKLVVQDQNGRWRLGDKNGLFATGMKNDLSSHYSLNGKDPNWKYPEWMKIMSLFNDYWKQKDDVFVKEIQVLIEKRSAFLHDNKVELETKHADIYTSSAFQRLFKCVVRLCGFL